jgi:hypothetical protein
MNNKTIIITIIIIKSWLSTESPFPKLKGKKTNR